MTLSVISIVLAVLSAIIIACDLRQNPQSMRIMNAVWVLTALWSSILGLVAYFAFGRERKMSMQMSMPMRPRCQSVVLSTLHCGAGCTLADIVGSVLLAMLPMSLIEGWGFSYLLALVIGVYFQFVAIREMNDLPRVAILKKAIKADFLSLTAWQLGMYLWMYTLIFHFECLAPDTSLTWDFWFAMQQAMLAGFILALPINFLLIRLGIKSAM